MKNQHFVYALDLGTYDKDGTPFRKFGVSSLNTFAGRCAVFQATVAKPPRLCGIILCDNAAHATDTEKAILSRLWKGQIESLPDSEMRRGIPDVLEFIETEMIDGEEFLGMDTGEWIQRNKKPANVSEESRNKKRLRDKKRRSQPEYKERQKEYQNRPDVKERNKEYQRKYRREYEKRPDVRQKKYERDRKRRERKKRGGNSPGQTSFL